MSFAESLTPNPQQLDFSRTAFTQTVVVAGVMQQVAFFSMASDLGAISFQIENKSGPALTAFKAQVRMGSDFQWQDYLAGAEWTATNNPLLRSFNSVDPTILAPGTSCKASIFTNGSPQVQFLASGAGTTLLVAANGILSGESL